MVKKAVPSHRRRRYGRVCVVVASLVVGFSVWAAQPATAIRAAVDDSLPNTQSAASTPANNDIRILGTGVLSIQRGDDFTRVTAAELQLFIPPEVLVHFKADRVSEVSGGSRILEGHVSITAARATSTDAQPEITSASATKAVITQDSGGGIKITLEHATVIGPRSAD